MLKDRADKIADPSARVFVWNQGVDVGREQPVFGLGYMAFSWHAHLLSELPESYYVKNRDNKYFPPRFTPHNLYLQLFVSCGLAGLGIWLLMAGYGMLILVLDLVGNRRLLNIPVLISMFGFHVYGIFHSMQMVPMIWLMVLRWQYGGNYHWMGKQGMILLPGNQETVALEFYCQTPDVQENPVTVTVSHQGEVLDTIVFSEPKSRQTRQYHLTLPKENTPRVRKLHLTVSRTWIPHAYLKNFDRRRLGVGGESGEVISG